MEAIDNWKMCVCTKPKEKAEVNASLFLQHYCGKKITIFSEGFADYWCGFRIPCIHDSEVSTGDIGTWQTCQRFVFRNDKGSCSEEWATVMAGCVCHPWYNLQIVPNLAHPVTHAWWTAGTCTVCPSLVQLNLSSSCCLSINLIWFHKLHDTWAFVLYTLHCKGVLVLVSYHRLTTRVTLGALAIIWSGLTLS